MIKKAHLLLAKAAEDQAKEVRRNLKGKQIAFRGDGRHLVEADGVNSNVYGNYFFIIGRDFIAG